jgi:hypothetical protein
MSTIVNIKSVEELENIALEVDSCIRPIRQGEV